MKDNKNLIKKDKNIYTVYKKEKRKWDPTRSKLAAALTSGLKEFPFENGSKVLYLGASTGTTVSHISDILTEGIIYALEFSERVFRSLMELAVQRRNVVPLFFDARFPEKYSWIEECDILYSDIAQSDQTQIAIRNANEFLKKGGFMFVAIKSQSIDVTKNPDHVYEEEKEKIKNSGFDIIDVIDLEPYEEKHAMVVGRKK